MKFRELMTTYQNHRILFEEAIEPTENALRIFISLCKTLAPESITIGSVTLEQCSPVVIDENLPMLQIDFDSYIGYSILNESYCQALQSETFVGSIFRIYSKSNYLDYITQVTIASADYPGPFQHYGFICGDHIIDVVSTAEPIISDCKGCAVKS